MYNEEESTQDNTQDGGGVFIEDYKPPFMITDAIVSYVSSISEKIGRITTIGALEEKPRLRKNNRIKSIHSSQYQMPETISRYYDKICGRGIR